MMTAFVHPRLGLPNFVKFQPYFLAAITEFDKGVDSEIKIEGYSPATIAARMRDSIMGYRINRDAWSKLPDIEPKWDELFQKHDGRFVISGPDAANKVIFRAKKPRGGARPALVSGEHQPYSRTISVRPAAQMMPQSYLRAKSTDRLIILAYGHLRGVNELDLPVMFPGAIEPSIIDELTKSFDLAFSFDPDRNETLMM